MPNNQSTVYSSRTEHMASIKHTQYVYNDKNTCENDGWLYILSLTCSLNKANKIGVNIRYQNNVSIICIILTHSNGIEA